MRAPLPESPLPPAGGLEAEPVRGLDRVRVLRAVSGDDDVTVPAETTGTGLAVYADGEAFEAEFTDPVDTLATVDADAMCLVERAVVRPIRTLGRRTRHTVGAATFWRSPKITARSISAPASPGSGRVPEREA